MRTQGLLPGRGLRILPASDHLWGKVRGRYTVAERLEQYSHDVEKRLGPSFESAGVRYPPAELAFVAFKDTKVLELYAKDAQQPWRFIKSYPVLAASGVVGPKLKEGDLQVPEGVYRLESLNPNSRFHLSVRLNYPNEFDRQMAAAEGRSDLGGDIMIHGSSVSVGCLAVGNAAAEEVFVLSGLVDLDRIKVLISPTDFRATSAQEPVAGPPWVRGLYETLRAELRQFRKGS